MRRIGSFFTSLTVILGKVWATILSEIRGYRYESSFEFKTPNRYFIEKVVISDGLTLSIVL
jgi:hypothetical protein